MSYRGSSRAMQYSSRRPEALYRSNSSLELEHHHSHLAAGLGNGGPVELRREYGSQGSIDIMGSTAAPAESFFAMLQDYRPSTLAVTDQRSPGPAEYLRGKVAPPPASENATNSLTEDGSLSTSLAATSPKLRLKLHRFWGGPGTSGSSKPPRHQTLDDSVVNNASQNCSSFGSEPLDERQRRRAFAHYDCQSLTANLGYAVKLRGMLLARRRNTATGASAASMSAVRAATPEGADSGDEDLGDGRGNDLLDSCPFFRNEVGGELERMVSLNRSTTAAQCRRQLHRPPLAYGVAILEFPVGDTHWEHGTCPHRRFPPRPIETVDKGANYYREYFYGQDHQNWFGLDDNLGPVAISIRRERLPVLDGNVNASQPYQYRLLIRTSELMTLRGSILEDAIPNLKLSNSSKGLNTKEVFEYVAPEINLSCLRLGVPSSQTEDQLLKLDEQGLTNHYKVGILYCKEGQNTEEEMYNNEESGPALLEFLDTIGQRVRLNGFSKYRAGLDNKTDSTGLYSVYSQYQDCEIMFHVSTLLPFTPNNHQQLLRKRHIGNDIVTIVFQEPGAQPFTPKNIRSQFQHVFIVVRAIEPCSENTRYSVAVSRSKEVPVFGPPIHSSAVFSKSRAFADFLLAKVINAENAAHRSEKFATMATRTRQEYLKDLANNYTTATLVDPGQKFSMLSFSSKKKDRSRPKVPGTPNLSQRGAISWQVVLDDSGQGGLLVECILGVSADTIVLIEEATREIVFVTPTKSVLGWSIQTTCLRIYHHQGECVTMHMREASECHEATARLRAVTPGSLARDLVLRRNPMGQLGFHVQPDGVVTQVENMGQAWQAGLVQGDRLVEICKVAVCTLSHDQMVDLLKTSATVTATVIKPSVDGTPKRGCLPVACRRGGGSCEGDYENVAPPAQAVQQQVVQARFRHERSFSPSGSSGYGSGGRPPPITDGTPTSSSSGLSSDDPWYESLDVGEAKAVESPPPPPLPARVGSSFQHVASPRIQDFKVGDKVTYLLPLPIRHGAAVAALKDGAKTTSLPPDCAVRAVPVNDGHSTDTSSASERLFGVQSEDELSTGSANVSPRMRRAKLTPSSGNSRNQSPRDTGEARLRPGVTSRSANRGSSNLSGSTLQEDLMRLINPDYIPDVNANASRLPLGLDGGKMSSGASSREDLSASDTATPTPAAAASSREHGEVIITTARPATVISNASTASSPAPSGKELQRLSPRVNKCQMPLPDPAEMDWPSLVDTATRAMLHDAARQADWEDELPERLSLDNRSSSSSGRAPDVRGQLVQLENQVARETRRRMSLEDEVRRLRDENSRLQEESQAAAQQLRRFTEWFFQTIDRQK